MGNTNLLPYETIVRATSGGMNIYQSIMTLMRGRPVIQ